MHSHTDPNINIHIETPTTTARGRVGVQGVAGGREEGSSGTIRARERARPPRTLGLIGFLFLSLCGPLSNPLPSSPVSVSGSLHLPSYFLFLCVLMSVRLPPPRVSLSPPPPRSHLPPAPMLGVSSPPFPQPSAPTPFSLSPSIPSLSIIPSSSPFLCSLPSTHTPCFSLPRVLGCTLFLSLGTSSLPQASIEKEGVTLVAILCTHKHW